MFRTRVRGYTLRDVPIWNLPARIHDATIPCNATDRDGAALRVRLGTCRHPMTLTKDSSSLSTIDNINGQ